MGWDGVLKQGGKEWKRYKTMVEVVFGDFFFGIRLEGSLVQIEKYPLGLKFFKMTTNYLFQPASFFQEYMYYILYVYIYIYISM